MSPDLLPSLVSYYQQTQCTKDVGYKLDLKRQVHRADKLRAEIKLANDHSTELRTQVEELQTNVSKTQAVADGRQREIESLRARQQDTGKVDKAAAESLRTQADSYKREIGELRDDLRLRDEELTDLRQDARERDTDLKEARNAMRIRDKEMKDVRDQVRARESEVRKANHMIEKLQATVQGLELEVGEHRDALEATKEALAESEERYDSLQAKKQIQPAPRPSVPIIRPKLPKQVVQKPVSVRAMSPQQSPEPEESHSFQSPDVSPIAKKAKPQKIAKKAGDDLNTDYDDPPSKPSKRVLSKSPVTRPDPPKSKASKKPVRSSADKENHDMGKRTYKKKVAALEDFSASPPRSSPPPESPKRKTQAKADFSMTPFVDKTTGKNSLPVIPLSPPSSKPNSKRSRDTTALLKDDADKPVVKKKRKLLGGVRTLMDDTPKKITKRAATINFGKELSPLKRPTSSSSGLILKD